MWGIAYTSDFQSELGEARPGLPQNYFEKQHLAYHIANIACRKAVDFQKKIFILVNKGVHTRVASGAT